jgi:uncharacterized protein (TIGR02270 family)
MSRPRARFIADILQTHLDDLAFLASQRRAALSDTQHTLRTFADLNERMAAHLQGVLVAPPEHLQAMLTPQLAAPDRDEAFAAAHVLLQLGDAASAHAVMVEFSRAKGHTLAGLRDALSMGALTHTTAELKSALAQAKPLTAVAAAVALANHRQLDAAHPRLSALITDEDAQVAMWAWRAAGLADAAARVVATAPPVRPLKLGVAHASPEVRHAAWALAAWTGQAQTLSALRQLAPQGDAAALHWLAVLGTPEDAPVIQKAALAMPDATARCSLLSRYGHPSALNALVLWMAESDVPLAVAAREAFTRLTGDDIRGARQRMPVPDDADEFTRDMAPDVWMPDVAKARALLAQHGERWASGKRWCAGHRLDGEVTRELLPQLDFDARWDVAVRAALAGRVISAPPPVH